MFRGGGWEIGRLGDGIGDVGRLDPELCIGIEPNATNVVQSTYGSVRVVR